MLKAEEYKDLSEIIEAAKQIERSFNHDLLKKSVAMDKTKRLIDYSPSYDCVEFKRIVTVQDSLEKLLSVRDMDTVVTKLFVQV